MRKKPAPSAPAAVTVTGLPKGVSRVRLTHYRIDDAHSNAYTVWKAMGSPQNPSAGPDRGAEEPRTGCSFWSRRAGLDVQDGAVTVSTEMPHIPSR